MNRIISPYRRPVASFLTMALLCSSPIAVQAQQAPAPVTRPLPAVTSSVQGGFEAATTALRRNQWSEAVRYFTPLVNVDTPEQRAQARFGLALALSQLGEDAKALQALEGTLRDETALGRAVGKLRGNLLLQLADRHLAEKGVLEANPWLAQYERLMDKPSPERYERIRAASDIHTEATPSLVLRVGVMLPMEGQLGEVGLSILHGLQLGLQEFDGRRGTRVELLVMNVGDAAQATKAAQALLDQNIDVLVGPLLAPAVTEVAETMRNAGVPVLALSNDRSVLGKGVYGLNYLPSEQAKLAARRAVSAGRSTFAVLAPTSPYGSEATEAFALEAKRLGATVTKTAFFDPKATDVGASIRELVGTTKGVVPFDGLFVPAPAAGMALLKAQLNFYDIDKAGVMLLGTGLWQNNTLLRAGTGMQDAVFAAPPKAFGFEQAYTSAFGGKANALAVVGYDTARILTDVAAEKQRTGQPAGQLLLRQEGFYGSGGYFAFDDSGVSARGLDVVKVGGSQFEVVAPALTLAPLPLPQDLQPAGNAGSWRF